MPRQKVSDDAHFRFREIRGEHSSLRLPFSLMQLNHGLMTKLPLRQLACEPFPIHLTHQAWVPIRGCNFDRSLDE